MQDFIIYLRYESILLEKRFINLIVGVPSFQTVSSGLTQAQKDDIAFYIEQKFSPFNIKIVYSSSEYNSAPSDRRCVIFFTKKSTTNTYAPINKVYDQLRGIYGRNNPGTVTSYMGSAFPRDPLKSAIIFTDSTNQNQPRTAYSFARSVTRYIGAFMGLPLTYRGIMGNWSQPEDEVRWANESIAALQNKLGLRKTKEQFYDPAQHAPAVKFKTDFSQTSNFVKYADSWVKTQNSQYNSFFGRITPGFNHSDLLIEESSSIIGHGGSPTPNYGTITVKNAPSQQNADIEYYKYFLEAGTYELFLFGGAFTKLRAQITPKLYEISEEMEKINSLSSKCSQIQEYPENTSPQGHQCSVLDNYDGDRGITPEKGKTIVFTLESRGFITFSVSPYFTPVPTSMQDSNIGRYFIGLRTYNYYNEDQGRDSMQYLYSRWPVKCHRYFPSWKENYQARTYKDIKNSEPFTYDVLHNVENGTVKPILYWVQDENEPDPDGSAIKSEKLPFIVNGELYYNKKFITTSVDIPPSINLQNSLLKTNGSKYLYYKKTDGTTGRKEFIIDTLSVHEVDGPANFYYYPPVPAPQIV